MISLILNGGFRYDDYNIKTSGFGTSGTAAGVFGQQAAEFLMPNFNLGVTWKPMPITQRLCCLCDVVRPGRRRVRRHQRQPTAAWRPILNGGSNQIFGPQKNTAIEVGNKWELFDRHLLVSGALFQTNVSNARESVNVTTTNPTAACPYPAGGVGTMPCITAGAAYQIQGIDLEVAGKITDKWSVFGGLVLMKSEVTKSLVPPANPALYTTNVGLPLANIAHQSFSLLSKYQLTDMWELGGQAVYRSKIYGGTLLAANQGTSLPSFWRFDAFAEARSTRTGR